MGTRAGACRPHWSLWGLWGERAGPSPRACARWKCVARDGTARRRPRWRGCIPLCRREDWAKDRRDGLQVARLSSTSPTTPTTAAGRDLLQVTQRADELPHVALPLHHGEEVGGLEPGVFGDERRQNLRLRLHRLRLHLHHVLKHHRGRESVTVHGTLMRYGGGGPLYQSGLKAGGLTAGGSESASSTVSMHASHHVCLRGLRFDLERGLCDIISSRSSNLHKISARTMLRRVRGLPRRRVRLGTGHAPARGLSRKPKSRLFARLPPPLQLIEERVERINVRRQSRRLHRRLARRLNRCCVGLSHDFSTLYT